MESLLLQEPGSGYFALEDGSGRILLETSGAPENFGSHGGGEYVDMRPRMILLNDDEIISLVGSLF